MASSDESQVPHLNGNSTNGNHVQPPETPLRIDTLDLDVLVLGAGFAGVYQLKHLRDLDYKVLLVDAGSGYGGTWHANRYPGIRVDSCAPHYQFTDPDLWKDWHYTQRFPGGAEIREYFEYVAGKWDLRKDTKFDTYIESANWDDEDAKWNMVASDGSRYRARFLVLCTGCLVSKFIPKWKDVDNYKGLFIHPSAWPREEPDLKDKKVAVIGTGATAVQIIQELQNVVGQLTVFQKTPNTAIPMRQVDYDEVNKPVSHEEIQTSFDAHHDSFTGFDFNFLPRSCFDDTPEKRREVYEALWREGDFKFWVGTYSDTLFDEAANRECYNFWRDKTRAKINDPKVADLLAPMKQAYAFGTKRIPLERGYFEVFNEPHVKLVDLNATPIERFIESGIQTTAEEMEFDVIIAATGFDAFTAPFTRPRIQGKGGVLLRDRWQDGVKTYLGMAMHSFPNMFFLYGPHTPSVFCNGPTCAELQGKWVVDTIRHCRENGHVAIEATAEAEKGWKDKVVEAAEITLLPATKSWYMGDNIPGKKREPLMYLGGVPTYYATLNGVKENAYEGFALSG